MRKRHSAASLRLLTPLDQGILGNIMLVPVLEKITKICLTTLDKVVGMFWFPCYSCSNCGVLWTGFEFPAWWHTTTTNCHSPPLHLPPHTHLLIPWSRVSYKSLWVSGCPYETWGYFLSHNFLKELQHNCTNISLNVKPYLDIVLFHCSQFLFFKYDFIDF